MMGKLDKVIGAVLTDPHGLPDRSQATIRLAVILNSAAVDLWEISTLQDAGEMWEQARSIASRILAACERPSPE
jgi:hypothetical protein